MLCVTLLVDFSVQNTILNTPSPEILKVLTPNHKYGKAKIRTPTNTLIFNYSPASSITPTTKSWISDLINMPSPKNN